MTSEQEFLYSLLNLSHQINKEMCAHLLVTPQNATLRVLGETLEERIVAKLQLLEMEENHEEKKPSTGATGAPTTEPEPEPEPVEVAPDEPEIDKNSEKTGTE